MADRPVKDEMKQRTIGGRCQLSMSWGTVQRSLSSGRDRRTADETRPLHHPNLPCRHCVSHDGSFTSLIQFHHGAFVHWVQRPLHVNITVADFGTVFLHCPLLVIVHNLNSFFFARPPCPNSEVRNLSTSVVVVVRLPLDRLAHPSSWKAEWLGWVIAVSLLVAS